MLDDYTTFDNYNWNGWATGSGTIERGELVEEEVKILNIYWAGLVDMGTVSNFEPALKKVFDIEPSNHIFMIDYQYRIRKAPDPGQHFLIAVTTPMHQLFRLNTFVDSDTPINQWLDAKTSGSTFFINSKEIWIGLWRNVGTINPPQWAIEFDNIRVKERA